MENHRLDLSQINWYAALPRLGVAAEYLSKRQGPCPLCGGNTRFRFTDKNGEGMWICNKCGAGNGLTLVAKVNRWSLPEAAKAIAEEARIVPLQPYIAASRNEPTRDELRSKLQKVWDDALPVVEGDPVWLYLHGRVPGLGMLPAPTDLRHHPRLPYSHPYQDAKGRTRYRKIGLFPALLAKIRDAEGRPVNLQRIYLDAAGKKATLPDGAAAKKMMMGVAKYTGGGVHLYAPDGSGRLGVGEGIETMLSVRAAYRNRLAVWSCLSEGGLRKFVIPSWVRELRIFADNDEPDEKGRRVGQEAGMALFQRALKEGFVDGSKRAGGRRVFLRVPKANGTDFNDEWLAVANRAA